MVDIEKERALATLRRGGGVVLIWCGLTALAFAPTVAVGLTTSVLLALGGLMFASGLTLFANAIKGELLRELRNSVGGGQDAT